MSGHGDTKKTAVWGGADVLIAPASATIPTGLAAFSGDWKFVGLLDGGQGFEEAIEVESTDFNAWGFGVVATTYRGQKTTKTFTALEENATVMGLVYDTAGMTFSDEDGTYIGDLAVKDFTEKVRIAFVTYSGSTEKRFISKNYATIAPSAAGTESEEALQSKGFTATVFPTEGRVLWYAVKDTNDDSSSSSSSESSSSSS
ncbi:MAG: hypothetical protein HZY75_13360 [Nocardioidaceae bacterium]|nr:MAG: hypothetical protein HZY75_13360 [Nocardioidaceae bacterium]